MFFLFIFVYCHCYVYNYLQLNQAQKGLIMKSETTNAKIDEILLIVKGVMNRQRNTVRISRNWRNDCWFLRSQWILLIYNMKIKEK